VGCPFSFSFCCGHFSVAEESQKAGRARLCRSKEKGVAWHQGAGRSRRKQFDLQRQRYEGLKINMNNQGIKTPFGAFGQKMS